MSYTTLGLCYTVLLQHQMHDIISPIVNGVSLMPGRVPQFAPSGTTGSGESLEVSQ